MKKLITIVLLISSLSVYGQDCKYLTNETDQFTGVKKLVAKGESVYEDREIEVRVASAVVGENKLIYWSFNINSSSAYSDYGSLSKGSSIMVKCGEIVIDLKIGVSVTGTSNYQYDYTSYTIYVYPTDEDLTVLRNTNINAVRVYWSKGYEDYNVEYGDVLVNQFKCVGL